MVEHQYMLLVSSVDMAVLVGEVVIHTQLLIVRLESKHKQQTLMRSSLLVVGIVDSRIGVAVMLGCKRDNLRSQTSLSVLESGL